MRVFLASLGHETSTFSPIPTSRAAFEAGGYHRPAGGRLDATCLRLNGYGAFAREAQADGHEVIASTYAWARPSGPCGRADYEALREEILDDLRRAGPVDLVLYFLHGAQIAEGCDDCEGDVLARTRAIVGPDTFVGALLDLHANVTDQMVEAASALVACREYPHIDFDERAVELYRLGVRAARGETRPHMRLRRLPMAGCFYTTEPQMADAVRAARALEAEDDILSVSLVHGFPFTERADFRAAVLAVADGLPNTLDRRLGSVADAFFAAREETLALRQGIDETLDVIEAAAPDPHARPFVVADAADNAGGGAGSDATFILERILARGLGGYALALFWDPLAAALAVDAGVGARLKLRLGGKTGPQAGRPLDVEARVLAVREAMTQQGIGFTHRLGTCVALEVQGNVVIANTERSQVFSPTCFTDLGVEPELWKALVVKSTQHFRAQFAPLARDIFYCETPGLLTLTIDPGLLATLPRPVWPLDAVASAAGVDEGPQTQPQPAA